MDKQVQRDFLESINSTSGKIVLKLRYSNQQSEN